MRVAAKKLIHLLLIVMLCYGNVVSSTHIVEHFCAQNHTHANNHPQTPAPEPGAQGAIFLAAHHIETPGCANQHHNDQAQAQATPINLAQLSAQDSRTAHSNGYSHADDNCGIYHTFLGACALLPAGYTSFGAAPSPLALVLPTVTHLVGINADSHRIRGPPTYS